MLINRMSRLVARAVSLLVLMGSATVGWAECSGVTINPEDNIQIALNNNPGATFCFQPGIYRLTQPLVPTNNQVLTGLPGAVLNGAKLLTEWLPSGSFWFITGQTQGPTQNRFGNFPSYHYPQSPFTDDVFL